MEDATQTLAALKSDSSGNYFYRPYECTQEAKGSEDVPGFPSYYVIPGRIDGLARLNNKRYDVAYYFRVWGYGKADMPEGVAVMQGRMAKDILVAFEVDPHRGLTGDECWDTHLLGVDVDEARLGEETWIDMRFMCPGRFANGAI